MGSGVGPHNRREGANTVRENQNVEWKESWRDDYLKWIGGFANADGGILEIGKNDKGQVVGITNIKKLLVDIPNKARDILGIVVDVDACTQNGKEFLRIVVPPYPYPISYRGEYHYRSGSTKLELKGIALDKFLLRKQGLHWDGVPIPSITVQSLDKDSLKHFRNRASLSKRLKSEMLKESDSNLIDKLHLRQGNHLKRAAFFSIRTRSASSWELSSKSPISGPTATFSSTTKSEAPSLLRSTGRWTCS